MEYTYATNERDNVKCWAARITGRDQRFGLQREFCGTRMMSDTSARHKYYNYSLTIQEGEIFEICFGFGGRYRKFITLENGEIKNIAAKEVFQKFAGEAQ